MYTNAGERIGNDIRYHDSEESENGVFWWAVKQERFLVQVSLVSVLAAYRASRGTHTACTWRWGHWMPLWLCTLVTCPTDNRR
jgi:hypothetical protein